MGDFEAIALDYGELGVTLVDEWAAHVKSASGHFFSEDYAPDVALRDTVGAVRLGLRSGFLIANEWLEAVTLIAKPPVPAGPAAPLESIEFTSTVKGARLVLLGDLQGPFGRSIPRARVELAPGLLGLGEDRFRLRVQPGPWLDGHYSAEVMPDPAPPDGRPIGIWIQVR